MFLVDLNVALVVGAVLGLLLHFKVGWRHPHTDGGSRSELENLIYLISLLFGFSWAGGLWLPPMGPGIAGSALLPFILTGCFIALLLITTGLGSTAYGGAPAEETTVIRQRPKVFGAYFAILHAGLLIFVILGYLV